MADRNIMVLFVDDDPLVLKAILRHYNWHPTISALAALNAEAALKLMEATPVDVVVSDLRMPSVNGIEFLRDVRQKYPRTACILLSGFLDSFWLKRAYQLTQVEAILSKPYEDERLDRELVEVVQRRWAQESLAHDALAQTTN
jgi:two-component system, response regulator YesN